MNANGIRIARWAVVIALFTTSVGQESLAAPLNPVVLGPTLVGQVAGDGAAKQLSRRDVDQLLEQARQALGDGNLQQAEALLERCENANVRYPILHFGLRPATVRRALEDAKRKNPTQRSPSMSTRESSADQEALSNSNNNHDGSLRDPFVTQQGQPSLATGSNSLSLPSRGALPATDRFPTTTASSSLSELSPSSTGLSYPQTAPTSQPLAQVPGLGPATTNPFKDAASFGTGDATLPPSLGLRSSALIGDQDEPLADEALDDEEFSPLDESEFNSPASPIPDLSAPLPPTLQGTSNVASAPLPSTTGTPTPLSGSVAPLPSTGPRYAATSESDAAPANTDKDRALELMHNARRAMLNGNLPEAESLVRQASALNVPESRFLPGEDRPSALAWDIQQVRQMPTPTSRYPQTASEPNGQSIAAESQAVHYPESDLTQNVTAATRAPSVDHLRFAQLPDDSNDPPSGFPSRLPSPVGATSLAAQLLADGEAALRNNDRRAALRLFQKAQLQASELDTVSRQRLAGHLQLLSSADDSGQLSPPAELPQQGPNDLMIAADQSQQVLARQLQAEVSKRQAEAQSIRETEPRQSLEILKEVRQQVADAQLADSMKSQLLRRIDITLGKTEDYIAQHRSEIELDEQNAAVLAEIDRRRTVKVKVQQDIAELVDDFNRLRDEQRYEEMEIVAQRLYNLAPDEAVVQQVLQNAKFIRRTIMNRELVNLKEDSVWNALDDVERSAIQNVGDGHELVFGNLKEWDDLTKNRRGSGDINGRLTERELEIRRRLNTPVLLRYEERPLSEVIQGLSELTQVNIHLDDRGLNQEGVSTDTPVTINLSKEISLKSALNLILEELHLSYVIKDEVLKITSEQLRDGELKTYTYNVADLVVPIPNFVPTNNIGLQGLLNDAHAAMGYGNGGFGAPGPVTLVNNDLTPVQNKNNPEMLAQQFSNPRTGTPNPSVPIAGGPGGLGGGANADFDSLIDLIVSTVATETWAENGGGEAEVRPFPTNLSLVISQTQAVHEEITDLLEQLRRLQDLQVTIEVRFIRLNDDFFERIGIDFDMKIEDNTGISTVLGGPGALTPGASFEPRRSSAVVGINQQTSVNDYPNYTPDLDINFSQDSFNLTAPTVGGFGQDMGQFGFALLSDIEATFLINAVQGDSRTNVLNAPKVTLFNGQQAFVADAIQRPFVISVIPVVGEFASAQQPVIVVLSEGTLVSIQAVVSDDRRYVRLTVVPFFSDIGDVDTFTFEGTSSSTSSSSSATDADDDGQNESTNDSQDVVTTVGTTVQLPTLAVVTIATTVSVPDGGTVLLGGIKRLSEGRDERGIPLLSKVPYVNRLFRNVGIGRSTDSLMMMVTPRIIIQEEEEEKLGILSE